MDARFVKVMVLVTAIASGGVCFGAPTPWPDAVVSFSQPAGSSSAGGPPAAAVGASDGLFVSIDTPEELILAFTDNRVFDGAGDDLWIYEAGDCGASVNVSGRSKDGPCTFLGTITNSTGLDLSDYPGLSYLDFIRFVGIDDSGQFDGYDLDAIVALNSVGVKPPVCVIPTPPAVLLGALGAGMVSWLCRRRML
jgi:hypothetical protein